MTRGMYGRIGVEITSLCIVLFLVALGAVAQPSDNCDAKLSQALDRFQDLAITMAADRAAFRQEVSATIAELLHEREALRREVADLKKGKEPGDAKKD